MNSCNRTENEDPSSVVQEKSMQKFPRGWQKGSCNTFQRFCFLYYSEAFADLTIAFQDGREFKVHKLILAMHSPVFETMFYGSLPHKEERLMMTNTSSDSFAWIKSYMYLGVIVLQDLKLAMEVYVFAHEKQIDPVVARCSKFLSNNLTQDNALALMNLAHIYDDEELKSNATKKIFERGKSIFTSDEIGSVPKNVLLNLISNYKMQISAKELFTAVYTWSKLQFLRRGKELTASSLREEMNDFLPHIHFLQMSTEWLISNVLATEIFTSKEAISILRKMNQMEASLPDFVSLNSSRHLLPEGASVNTSKLVRFPQCNNSFYYNHTEEGYSDKIIIIKVSENVFIKSIKLKTKCFIGSWKIHLMTREDKEIAVSSNDFSPWTFDRPIQLTADKSYVFRIEGRGKRAKHRVVDYESCTNTICFSGFAINCSITLFYLI